MSPLSKAGSYHMNPATARMHDAAEPHGSEPEGAPAGDAHAVEIHHPNHPETGDGQNFHARVHHADGSMEESKHPSFDDAAAHGAAVMGAEGDADTEPDSDEDDSEGSGNDADDDEY